MEVKPITVYVSARTLDGVLSVFGLSELNAIFDKALQTVFEKPLNEIMNEPMDYSNAWRVKFTPSLSNYLIWSKLSEKEIPYVMDAFDRVLSHMLTDYLFSLMEQD